MIFTETSIHGAHLVDLRRMEDPRGFFARAWSSREFAEKGLETDYPDVNFSHSTRKGTIRGMHYQKAPHEEAKFVRCVRGALFDVIIDLRPASPTYLKWAGFEISASSYQAIYVPPGCAHGVQTLEDNSEMLYMVSACYQPGAEGGIRWDDPFFGIEWPDVGQRIISDKDLAWPDFQPIDSTPRTP
jgi:dTDP-4-dehydrorhamnose 3,5-epimerase